MKLNYKNGWICIPDDSSEAVAIRQGRDYEVTDGNIVLKPQKEYSKDDMNVLLTGELEKENIRKILKFLLKNVV